jgi:hypothetical protein
MKELIRLIAIANRLDQRGLTKEADKLDRIMRKMAQSWPHDDDDEEISEEEALKWLDAQKGADAYGDEEGDMFGEGGPSEAELMAMESGVDIFAGEDFAMLKERLDTLTREMQMFTDALVAGKLEPKEFEIFERIKEEFTQVAKMVEQAEAGGMDLGFDA